MSAPSPPEPALGIRQISKSYGGLRPLRIASLTIAYGERVSIGGIDAGAGELLVNLVTGASLPDAGEVRLFGRSTADISSGEEWLDSLERFGIVSPRAVLLEGSTLQQNLAMSFTLSIDPVPPAVGEQVLQLAMRCGIDPDRWLAVPAGALPPDMRVRAHLARSLALDPAFIVLEHPTADVEPAARPRLAADLARACTERGVTMLVLTNDDEFAKAVAPRNLRLHAATGELKRVGRGWLSR
jgi:ABC-type transporter Mla maintaining outer membrane lipid asymmetry ATPase subunit MlaF